MVRNTTWELGRSQPALPVMSGTAREAQRSGQVSAFPGRVPFETLSPVIGLTQEPQRDGDADETYSVDLSDEEAMTRLLEPTDLALSYSTHDETCSSSAVDNLAPWLQTESPRKKLAREVSAGPGEEEDLLDEEVDWGQVLQAEEQLLDEDVDWGEALQADEQLSEEEVDWNEALQAEKPSSPEAISSSVISFEPGPCPCYSAHVDNPLSEATVELEPRRSGLHVVRKYGSGRTAHGN